MGKGKLTDRHRAIVVRELAAFATPKQVAEILRERFGIEISVQSIEHYDPEKKAAGNLAKKWVEMFWRCRKAFLAEVEGGIPEANKAVRVRQLAEAAREFKAKGNYMAMADMLERIAKEMGNVHTNRREHTGKDGGPIRTQDVSTMTDEQLNTELLLMFGKKPEQAETKPH